MKIPRKILSIKPIYQAIIIFAVLTVGAAVIIMSQNLNKQKDLSIPQPQAQVTNNCDVEIVIPTPTSTPIPPTPTPTRTPTKSPTKTPTPAICITSIPTAIPTIACVKKLDIALVIDKSGSMGTKEADGRTKMAWAKEAASTFMNTLKSYPYNKNNVRVALVSFGASGTSATLNRSLTNVYDSIITTISSLKSGGYTCIQCGIRIGNSQLTSTYKKVEILLSDGQANRIWDGTNSNSKAAAITEANTGRTKGISYKVIGYGTGNNIDQITLKSIAGGSTNYQYKPDAKDWSTAFLNILKELCL